MIDEVGKRIVTAADWHVLGDGGQVGIGRLGIIEVGPNHVSRLIEPPIEVT